MKDIAREAGVAQGLLHYYFDGKERLVAALVAGLLDEHLDRFRGPKASWRLLFEVLAGSSREGHHRQLAARFAERRGLIAEHIGGRESAARALLLDALMLGLAAERLAGATDRETEDAFDAFVELIS